VSLPGLSETRAAIDQIDHEILSLLGRRLELVLQVGEIKRAHGAEAHDPARERQVLERLVAARQSPLTPELVTRVFECVIHECRSLEQRHIAR
jgi:chorismate mutase